MTNFFKSLILILAFNSQVFGADPQYFRELEGQIKAEQAHSMRKSLGAEDFAEKSGFEVQAYHFDLELLVKESKLSGTVTLDLLATNSTREVVLDSVGLNVSKVWLTDLNGVRSELNFQKSSGGLKVFLPIEVSQNQTFSLTVAYAVTGEQKGRQSSAVEKGLNFVNADGSATDVTPAVYTSVEPQLARTWFPCIDDPSVKAKRTTMRLSVPEGWYAVSNGALKAIENHPETKSATYLWEENFPIATYLISIALGPFTVIEDKSGSLPVNYYVPKKDEEKARFDFGRTPQIIDYFSKLWTPYPFEKYSMTTVPYYSGAMEHTTATTMSDVHLGGDRESEDTIAHEIAHHWFGNSVTLSDWNGLWLNEGFATYAEVLFNEHFKGTDAAKESLLWDLNSYLHYDAEGVSSVVDLNTQPEEKFSPASYEKGAWVLNMLRKQLGDQAFFEGCKLYLKRHAFANASTTDVQKAFEAAAARDLTEFFKQWVYGPGYPTLAVNWSFDKDTRALKLNFSQGQPHEFSFPIEVMIAGNDSNGQIQFATLQFDLNQRKQEFSQVLPANFPLPRGIWIDPELKILKKVAVERSEDEIRFWLATNEINGFSAWIARVDAIESINDTRKISQVIAHDVVSAYKIERSASVRASIFDLFARTHNDVQTLAAEEVGAIRDLIKLGLMDPNVDVRASAATALGFYLTPELSDLLVIRFEQEPAIRARASIARSLARSRHPRAFELLYGELQKASVIAGHRKLVQAVLESFGVLGDRRAAAILLDTVNGSNPYLQTIALESLGSLAVPETFNAIVEILENVDKSVELRVAAAHSLGNYGGLAAIRALNEQLKVEKNDVVRKAIKATLDRLGGVPDWRGVSVKGSPALLQW